MNIFNFLKQQLTTIIEKLIEGGELKPTARDYLATITIEPCKNENHGDIACNAALVLASSQQQPPRDIAKILAPHFNQISAVIKCDIAGPGFINLTLAPSLWQNVLFTINEDVGKFSDITIGHRQKVNIEYLSTNPTGPLHIGHLRIAVVGNILANILQRTGFKVTQEYYVNNAGRQIDVLAESVYHRYLEFIGNNPGPISDEMYPGDYLIPLAKQLAADNKELSTMRKDQAIAYIKPQAVEAMMALITNDLDRIAIKHDVFRYELDLHNEQLIEQAIDILKQQNLIESSTLAPPKGKLTKDWQAREQLVFKSTAFGDDEDRPLTKSDGSYTYFAADLGYLVDKINRGYNMLIMVLGADHIGYSKRIEAALEAISGGKVKIKFLFCNIVKLLKGGKLFKMSKRAGNLITVNDILDFVDQDALRMTMVSRKHDMNMNFDIDKVNDISSDNPVFYIQYAHARCHSIMQNIREQLPKAATLATTNSLDLVGNINNQEELRLVKLMAKWPRMLESAATTMEPHRIMYYLNDLASEFHSLWQLGREHEHLRFIRA
ncbi:MAG: arginine--tRNA ligase, partial [Pseudomonadota bacterium]